jgi:uncharacterized membrane protein YvlD (DUF360 family)
MRNLSNLMKISSWRSLHHVKFLPCRSKFMRSSCCIVCSNCVAVYDWLLLFDLLRGESVRLKSPQTILGMWCCSLTWMSSSRKEDRSVPMDGSYTPVIVMLLTSSMILRFTAIMNVVVLWLVGEKTRGFHISNTSPDVLVASIVRNNIYWFSIIWDKSRLSVCANFISCKQIRSGLCIINACLIISLLTVSFKPLTFQDRNLNFRLFIIILIWCNRI